MSYVSKLSIAEKGFPNVDQFIALALLYAAVTPHPLFSFLLKPFSPFRLFRLYCFVSQNCSDLDQVSSSLILSSARAAKSRMDFSMLSSPAISLHRRFHN